MKLQNSDLPYITGEAFSNGRAFEFELEEEDNLYRSRTQVLTDLVRDKQIIHVGCVDHDVKSIEKKITKGKWLHRELDEAAERCLGVDINQEGVDYIKNTLGYADVMVADVTADPAAELLNRNWDYFLLPEVLEHINNPVDFLESIHANFRDNVGQLVITVPNAFTPDNARYARKGKEVINTDHRYWFTPYTLSKVVVAAGFKVNRITMCRHGKVKKRSVFKNRWFSRHPLMRSDIVMLLDF
ncbi:MAG: class I SAM-dependent methyltransferase [Gammaproteobacteria bacterium]|nr:class I SAM-dependent methyltransferase [Gammaproteobacteria bacterium]